MKKESLEQRSEDSSEDSSEGISLCAQTPMAFENCCFISRFQSESAGVCQFNRPLVLESKL